MLSEMLVWEEQPQRRTKYTDADTLLWQTQRRVVSRSYNLDRDLVAEGVEQNMTDDLHHWLEGTLV